MHDEHSFKPHGSCVLQQYFGYKYKDITRDLDH